MKTVENLNIVIEGLDGIVKGFKHLEFTGENMIGELYRGIKNVIDASIFPNNSVLDDVTKVEIDTWRVFSTASLSVAKISINGEKEELFAIKHNSDKAYVPNQIISITFNRKTIEKYTGMPMPKTLDMFQ